MLIIIQKSIEFLKERQCDFIILASNSPSVTILSDVKSDIPVIGIYPPVKDVANDGVKNTLLLGAKVMTESKDLQNYIKNNVGDKAKQFHCENASSLIGLIESGDFLQRPAYTFSKINDFMQDMENKYGKIDSLLLSSTHLPWLEDYFRKYNKDIKLYDPSDELINSISKYVTEASGKIDAIITESKEYPTSEFIQILDKLKINLDIEIK